MIITKSALKPYISMDEALLNIKKEYKDNYKNYINPNLVNMLRLIGFDKVFIRAEGMRVWDIEENIYLDFLGGYGALNLGHNPSVIYEGIYKIQKFPNILQVSMNGITAALAKNLAAITPGDLQYTFFSNSGAESVEYAIKMARAATGKSKIVYCRNSFHGKTMGALSVTGREKYRSLFKPLLEDTISIEFDNIKALEDVLSTKDVAAFILEPIQGEGGINVPKDGYLKKVRNLCSQFDALMILDEVQTGFGRTGKLFACEHEAVVPDIMCMAKSLGGGVMPIGATIANKEVWKKAFGSMERCLLHTSTFGGNTLSSTAGIVVIEEIFKSKLWEQAEEKGDYMLSKLKDIQKKYPIIKEVRGKGLMIGLEFCDQNKTFRKVSNEYLGALVAGELLNKHKIITAYTLNNPNVIRLEPPLIVNKEDIDYVLNSLEKVLKTNKSFVSLALNSTKNLINYSSSRVRRS